MANDRYDEGYANGREDAYMDGYDKGYADGYIDGAHSMERELSDLAYDLHLAKDGLLRYQRKLERIIWVWEDIEIKGSSRVFGMLLRDEMGKP